MRFVFFDLDNTLLAGDSDHAWGRFLVDEALVDARTHAATNDYFHRQYEAGELDIRAFQRFTLAPLVKYPTDTMLGLRQRFVADRIRPMVARHTPALIARHRERGDAIAIVTATNRFIAAPIAELLGVDHLIATEPEIVDGAYTGEIIGTPAYREGKIELAAHAVENAVAPVDAVTFYSDSLNDLPLLRWADYPVAVDPDATLEAEARAAGWPIITLSGEDFPLTSELVPRGPA